MPHTLELTRNCYDSHLAIVELEENGRFFVAWKTLDSQIVAFEKENYDVNSPDKIFHIFRNQEEMIAYVNEDTVFSITEEDLKKEEEYELF